MSIRAKLEKEACRVEEDSLYSSKGHFEAAAWYGRVHLWLGLPAAILAGIATAFAFADLGIWAGVLSIVVTALTAVVTFVNPSQRQAMHHAAGVRAHALRSRLRFFREIELVGNAQDDELVDRLRAMCEEYQDIRSSSPQIPNWAYGRARKGIEEGQAAYEIDGP